MAGELGTCPDSPDGKHDYRVVDEYMRGYHIVLVHECIWCEDRQET